MTRSQAPLGTTTGLFHSGDNTLTVPPLETPTMPTATIPSAPPSTSAIHIESLTHRYAAASKRSRNADVTNAGDRPALDAVSFDVRPGEIFGVLGPNGGGKSTLFKILATILAPTAGRVSIFGRDLAAEPDAVRQMLGVVFQSPSLDNRLTAAENLLHQGHLYGLSGADLQRRIDENLRRFKLADRAGERVERFSGGMRRRVELAKAMLHHPRLLLLDEPSTGLDPGARRDLRDALFGLRDAGVTVALTTHLMDEADRCDRLAILSAGKLIAVDTPENLKSRIGGDVVMITPETSSASAGTNTPDGKPDNDAAITLAREIADRMGPWKNNAAPRALDGVVHLEHDQGVNFVAAVSGAFPGRIRSVTVGRPTLEDVFLHLTGQSLGDTPAPTPLTKR